MNELIKITELDGNKVVNARELHQFLDSRQEFTNWIKNRIEKYQFIDGVDYTSFDKIIKRDNGGTLRKEYAISIDMAKELAMIENNENGKKARRYFIEAEKKNRFDITNADTVLQIAQQYKDEQDKRKALENKLREIKPYTTFYKAVKTAKQSCLVGELAKILRQNGINIGQNRLFEWLRKQKYLGSKGEMYNQPLQRAMDMGLFELKKSVINKPDGTQMVVTTTKVTIKGQVFFANKFIAKWSK